MKLAVRGLDFNTLSPLVTLLNRNRLPINWADTDCFAVFRICQRSVTSDALPGLGRENAATGMCDRQQVFTSCIESHSNQSSNDKMFGLYHRKHSNITSGSCPFIDRCFKTFTTGFQISAPGSGFSLG
jgi:hypothetical protein